MEKERSNVGFSKRAHKYYVKGGFFDEDKTFDGKLKDLYRTVGLDPKEPKSHRRFSFHEFVIQKGVKTRSYVFKGAKDIDLTGYYQPGELVRHHFDHAIPEKYDKTTENYVVCIVCGEFVSKKRRQCPYCGGVLLK